MAPRACVTIVVRTSGSPLRHADTIRRLIWSTNADQTITAVTTLNAVIGGAVARPLAIDPVSALRFE